MQKVDINKVKEATRILEEAKDQKAEKGHKLLKELTGNYKKNATNKH